MDEIKELIKIVSDHTKKNLPLLDLKKQHLNGNKEMNLFLGIKTGQFNNDEEASVGIYGSEEVDFKFRMLKSRLNRKLLNHLFFMDFSTAPSSKTVNTYQEALDYLHFSRMLLKIGETSLGTKLLYKTIDIAKEGEYTVVIIDCLRELREVYSKTFRPKLFQNIKSQLMELEALERIEERANSIFQENRLFINSSVTNRKKSLEPFAKGVAELWDMYLKSDSYNIFEKFMKMQIWYHELNGDFEKVLLFTDKVMKDHEAGLINRIRFNEMFLDKAKGNALIKLRMFDEGADFLDAMLNKIDDSSKEWYVFAEKYVMLNIQRHAFDKASAVFQRVAATRNFDNLEKDDILRWNVLRSYLYHLTSDKKIVKKFGYEEFIATTPVYEKDKAGINVALLILQILEYAQGDLTKLHEKLNAIDDYVSKFLNNSFSKRTKTFCKLLHKIATHNRDYDTISQKSRYLREKLNDSEVAGKTFVDMEIVPYEFLWEKITTELKTFKA